MPRLENWSIVSTQTNESYIAPEYRKRHLVGEVFDHPVFWNGKEIETSSIQQAEGKVVVTRTGTRYELGQPDPNYLDWLRSKGLSFDPEHPVKIKEMK